MTEQIGVVLPDVPPLLHYAERLDVVAWMIRSVSRGAAAEGSLGRDNIMRDVS